MNVRDFGAVGDGTTNDTTAIENALAAAAGDVLYFPPATAFYKIDKTLTVPAQTVLTGASGGTFWRRGTSIVKKTNGDTNGSAMFAPGRDCVFRWLDLEGPDEVDYRASTYPAGTANCSYGINATSNAYGMRVEGCTFAYFKAAGITGSYNVPHVIDSHFVSNLYGIDWASADAMVHGSCFRHNVHSGFRSSANFQQLVGNRVEWNARYGIELTGGEAVISGGNILDRNGWAAISVGNGAYGVVIVGNYFARNAAGGDSSAGRSSDMTTTATDAHGNVMYLEPGSSTPGGVGTGVELDKAHIKFGWVKYAIIAGNRFRAGRDDGNGGAASPKYCYALGNGAEKVILDNQDEVGWQHAHPDLGGDYAEGAGQRIYTSGAVNYNELRRVGDALSTLGRLSARQLFVTGAAGAGYVDLVEQSSAPAAPDPNHARLYVQDSGGKTQLRVRFNTGLTQVIATEP